MSSAPPFGQQEFPQPSSPQKQASGVKKKVALFGCLGLLVVFFGCALLGVLIGRFGENKNVNTNSSNQPISSQPAPSVLAYASGGLGLDRAEWERLHGGGRTADPVMFFEYENGRFQVSFSGVRTGNVNYIERVWGDRNSVRIEEARRESRNFIPADAEFVRTYTSRGGSTVDLYKSESLKSRFSADDWTGGQPGDFIILYRNQTGRTTTFIIGVGNNP